MPELNIAIINGSLRKDSINQKLIEAIKPLAPKSVKFSQIDISKLPVFNQDDENELVGAVKEFHKSIQAADAILFVTPEHNRSVPAALKNALDWGSRPYEANSWMRKPAAVAGATGGPIGTFGAQNHLRQMLVAVGCFAMAKPELYFSDFYAKFDESGHLNNDDSRDRVKGFIDAFVEWVNYFKN